MALYRVVGPRPVRGHVRGEVVDLDLSPALESALVESGHIELVSTPDSDPYPPAAIDDVEPATVVDADEPAVDDDEPGHKE